MNVVSSLKWFHFLGAWIACIITGIFIQSIIMMVVDGGGESIGFSLLFALVAFIASLPFIIVFCIVIHFTALRKPKSKGHIHRSVFLWHLAGSILVLFGLIVFFNNDLRSMGLLAVMGIMGAYFTIDSIYFHLLIRAKVSDSVEYQRATDDLLDSQIV